MSHEPEKPRPVEWRTRLLAFSIAVLVRLLCATVRFQVDREDEMLAVVREHDGGMFVTWHGRTMLCINHFRRRGYYALVSLSKDGDLLAEEFRFIGMRVIRGSTKRRGVGAAREAVACLKNGGIMAFTPDGPRGPRNVAQPGVAYFAQKSGRPIIPTGLACDRCWLLNSWDKYLIPKPFSRARWIFGDPIFVGPTDDLEEVCRQISDVINALEAEAERTVGRTPEWKQARAGISGAEAASDDSAA